MEKSVCQVRQLNKQDLELILKYLQKENYVELVRELIQEYEIRFLYEKTFQDSSPVWEQKPIDKLYIWKTIYEYKLGEKTFKRRKHAFTVMYTEEKGEIVSLHGHGINEAELYIYYIPSDATKDGTHLVKAEFCRVGEKHSLVNKFHGPVYIVSIKTTRY